MQLFFINKVLRESSFDSAYDDIIHRPLGHYENIVRMSEVEADIIKLFGVSKTYHLIIIFAGYGLPADTNGI